MESMSCFLCFNTKKEWIFPRSLNGNQVKSGNHIIYYFGIISYAIFLRK